MTQAIDKAEMLRQNLADDKYSKQMTEKCIRFAQKGLYTQMLQQLKAQRAGLLDVWIIC